MRGISRDSPKTTNGAEGTGRRQNPGANGTVFDFLERYLACDGNKGRENVLWKFVTANEKLKILNCDRRDRLILDDVRKGNIDSEIVSDRRAGQPTVEALITGGLQK